MLSSKKEEELTIDQVYFYFLFSGNSGQRGVGLTGGTVLTGQNIYGLEVENDQKLRSVVCENDLENLFMLCSWILG